MMMLDNFLILCMLFLIFIRKFPHILFDNLRLEQSIPLVFYVNNVIFSTYTTFLVSCISYCGSFIILKMKISNFFVNFSVSEYVSYM